MRIGSKEIVGVSSEFSVENGVLTTFTKFRMVKGKYVISERDHQFDLIHPGTWVKYASWAVGEVNGMFMICLPITNHRLEGLEGSMYEVSTEEDRISHAWQRSVGDGSVHSFGEYGYYSWPVAPHMKRSPKTNWEPILVTEDKPWRGPNAYRWEDVY